MPYNLNNTLKSGMLIETLKLSSLSNTFCFKPSGFETLPLAYCAACVYVYFTGGENFVALDLIVQHVHSQLEKVGQRTS